MSEFSYQEDFVQAVLGQKKNLKLAYNPYLKGERALQIYQEDYQARLTEALGETYPSVWGILGDEDFFILAKDYIKTHPSQSYSLQHYGEGLALFLLSSPVLQEFPYLADLARLDWAFHTLFHQSDERPVGAIGPELFAEQERPLSLSRTLFFLSSPFPLNELWQAAKKNAHDEAPQWQGPELAQTVSLFKKADKIYSQSLGPELGALLQELQEKPLGEVFAGEWSHEHIEAAFAFLAENDLLRQRQ